MASPKKRATGGGRKPLGPHHKMSESTTIRLTEATRAALNKKSEQLKMSRSQIVESALRDYLDKEAARLLVWGPPRVYAAALCFAKIIRQVEINVGANPFNESGTSWLDDRFAFEAARAGIVQFLEMLSADRVPAGEARPSDEIVKRAATWPEQLRGYMTSPEGVAAPVVNGLYHSIETAREMPTPPPGTRYAMELYQYPKIKADLGLGKGPNK